MKVALRDMPCHRRVELGSAFVAQAVAGLPMRAALERPADDPNAGAGAAEVDLYIEGDNVFARGVLSGWIEVACSRCVGAVRLNVAEPLHITFMPAARLPAEDEDDEAVGDAGWDLDNLEFDGITNTPFASVVGDAGDCPDSGGDGDGDGDGNDDGGCGCRTGGDHSSPWGWLVLAALVVPLARGRRRRRTSAVCIAEQR